MNLKDNRILITGGHGFLGSHVREVLLRRGANYVAPPHSEYDLTQQHDARLLFRNQKPEIVIHLAADVGGIQYNKAHPGSVIYNNLAMGTNVIEACREYDVGKLVFVSTVCAYPKHCPTPFVESAMFNGYPEETNAPYGIAKRALGVMLDAYHRQHDMAAAHLLPANLYGPGDNFNPESSHVIPGMIVKMATASASGADAVTLWGSGKVSREFLYVADAAEAVVRAAETISDPSPINIGTGHETMISELAGIIADKIEFDYGEINWDTSMPDGQPKRRLDVTQARSRMQWESSMGLSEGIAKTVQWYLANREKATSVT